MIDLNIDLTKMANNIIDSLDIDITYSFKDLSNTDILKLDDVKITGKITKNSLNDYYLDVNVSGVCIKPCALTLKPVNTTFDFKIEGLLSELMENTENVEKTLDIFPIIWENILVEIPNRVVSGDKPTVTSGNGWKLVDKLEEKNNPELEKLKDLLRKEV